MAAPQFSSCPLSAKPGEQVTLTGTTDSCSSTHHEVAMNGVTIPHTWDCDDGAFSMTFTVPACVPGRPNVISARVTESGDSDDCDVQVNCG